MKKYSFCLALLFVFFPTGVSFSQTLYPDLTGSLTKNTSTNKITSRYMPVIGVWVWGEEQLKPDGYKKFIDQAGNNSPYNLLIPFLRFHDKEVVEEVIHNQVKLAAAYAIEQNIALVPDLDIRSARRAFRSAYPQELQEMLRLKEVPVSGKDSVEVVFPSLDLNDHYSGGKIQHHVSLSGTLLRAYSYKSAPEGIEGETIKEITSECRVVFSSKDSLVIKIPPAKSKAKGKDFASVMVSFTHLYPDIFSPHIMEFQQKIIKQYSDIPLAGVCKDEWGFPPYYPRFFRSGFDDFWYSKYRAQAYAERTGGRDLLSDFLLMAKGIKGKESERQMTINHFMEMSRHRNSALEEDFYNTVKEVFGKDAAVTVHSTWWPYPDRQEFNKNGLDWWTAKRDWAQTDEVAPYAVRTALSKKCGSPVWYNMYYKEDLSVQVWSSALAGGRIDYLGFQSLFNKDIMRAENRIRLLNYISNSPLDCRVAVIFGHACAMNWAGPHYNDVGMQLIDSLWKAGYPTDLIPTSEIENGSLRIDAEGYITYGAQRYSAVVLYHPEFEKSSTAEFFQMADKGKTTMIRTGNWTKDFNGTPFDGNNLLPKSMIISNDFIDAFLITIEVLKKNEIAAQTPATGILDNTYFKLRDFKSTSLSPATTGISRLIDGTVIQVAGTYDISGDPIKNEFTVNGFPVFVDAIGVAAVRLDDKGHLQAIAAGSLKSLNTVNIVLELEERADIALWKNDKGEWQGVLQGNSEIIPAELLKITSNWVRLYMPEPPE